MSNAEALEKRREMRKERGKMLVSNEKMEVVPKESKSQSMRAAARDVHWKTKLCLNPFKGQGGGSVGNPEQGHVCVIHSDLCFLIRS